MKIWMINQYNALPKHGHLNRHFNFAKRLKALGHEPVLFLGSSPHNTDLQLVTGKARYTIDDEAGFKTVLVRAVNYNHSMAKRIRSMMEFYRNVLKCADDFERPDVIIGSSAHPLNCVAAIKLAKRYGCPCICEVRDLWPESIVAYGVAGRRNPVVQMLYRLEKWIYKKADALIFTMEGGRDYIVDKGWDSAHGGPIELDKVFHINNGVDLAQFERDREAYPFADRDLEDPDTFKVVYCGSIRKANNVEQLVRCAKVIQNSPRCEQVKFILFGDGDERDALERLCERENVKNVAFKGMVEKKYIPYILSKSNLNLLNYNNQASTVRYGGSQNKLFEYLASGRPICANLDDRYSVIERYNCGVSRAYPTVEDYAAAVLSFAHMPQEEYEQRCKNARAAAAEYDFACLTEKLLEVCEKAFQYKERQKKTGEQGV